MSGLSRGNPVAKHKKMIKKQLFNNKCLCVIRDVMSQRIEISYMTTNLLLWDLMRLFFQHKDNEIKLFFFSNFLLEISFGSSSVIDLKQASVLHACRRPASERPLWTFTHGVIAGISSPPCFNTTSGRRCWSGNWFQYTHSKKKEKEKEKQKESLKKGSSRWSFSWIPCGSEVEQIHGNSVREGSERDEGGGRCGGRRGGGEGGGGGGGS